jgi:formate-dependent phosphoribosylglycinamide formyltransferase (GAR transformylase)
MKSIAASILSEPIDLAGRALCAGTGSVTRTMSVSEDEIGLGVIAIRRYLQAQASMPRRYKTVAAIADGWAT